MNPPLIEKANRKARCAGAFTLIEIVGTLAVIAILALVLVPVIVRQMDRIAGEQESASLKAIGEALQQNILRNRYIPGAGDWATNVAKELGFNISNVKTNARRQPRYVFIEHDLQIGPVSATTLPYQQTSSGAPTAPVNARFLVVSSIGQPLPPNLPSIPSEADFNAIWDWNDASRAAPTNATILAGFTRGEDLRVQRVNIAPLFVSLWLTIYASPGAQALYSIDDTNSWSVVPSTGTNAYFIKNSVLTLGSVRNGTNTDSQQILIRNSSFVYNAYVWRGSISGGTLINGLDIAAVVDQYLKAPANPRAAHTNQQAVVVQAMQDYLDAYVQWAGVTFDPAFASTPQRKQHDMVIAVQGQYLQNNFDPPPLGIACPP